MNKQHVPHNLTERLLEFIRSAGYRPMKDHDLADEMSLPHHRRADVRGALRELADRGLVQLVRGNRWAAARSKLDVLTGTISISPQGHGMVRLPGRTGADAELFIPPHAIGGALHGDEVEVEKVAGSPRREARRREEMAARFRSEGRVLRVVRRNKTTLVGLLMRSAAYWYVIPDHPRINQNIVIEGSPEEAPGAGDSPLRKKVVVKLLDHAHGDMLAGEVVEVLGFPGEPGVDVLCILREHAIATGFSEATQREAKATPTLPTGSDTEGRLDLRGEMIVTIDPADARDHDDAVSLRRRPEGGWILGVHIADVSHFVSPGSAIDRDAREHGNSVYMVDRFIPMLPSYLTSEVCSLKAGRDRLAYSVFITYDEHAAPLHVEMSESVIHPRILIDYDRVQELITGRGDGGIDPVYHDVLRDMHDLATRLRRHRMHHGAIDLTMPEVHCELDAEGRPVSMHRRTSAEAYHLIEECMLAANVAVAERLRESGVPAIYRIHEDPSEDQWQQMALDLQQLGLSESPTDRHDIQRISRAHAKEALAYPISIAILRNLKRAVYSAECSPHFGLAFDRYTHFTSPIRRYSDLVVHRILKHLDKGERVAYRKHECEEVAEHCSRREREAGEAEEESLLIKRIQYYEILLEKGEIGPWPALITGSTTRGLLVEVVDTLQRGFIPTHALPDPSLQHDRETGFIKGRKGRTVARIGDVIPVELMRVDHGRRSIELRWVEGNGSAAASGRKTRREGRGGGKRQRRR